MIKTLFVSAVAGIVLSSSAFLAVSQRKQLIGSNQIQGNCLHSFHRRSRAGDSSQKFELRVLVAETNMVVTVRNAERVERIYNRDQRPAKSIGMRGAFCWIQTHHGMC